MNVKDPVNANWLKILLNRGHKERFTEILLVTPERAAEILLLNNGNRPLSKNTVLNYAQIMSNGRWRLTTEAITIAKNDTLINGQHRLNAVIESQTSVEMTVWFGCDPEEFKVVDRARKRSVADMLAVMGYSHATVRAAIASILFIAEGNTVQRLRDSEQLADYTVNLTDPYITDAIHQAKRFEKLASPSSTGAAVYWMLKNTKKTASDLEAFLQPIPSGEMLSGARLKLREWLISKPQFTLAQARNAPIIKAAAIVNTWNAEMNRRKRVCFDWDKTTLPDVV